MSCENRSHIIYSLEEKPPFLHWILLGLQYACMMFPYLIIIVIIGRTQGIVNTNAISFSLIALGVATILQSLKKGPIGSGYLAPPVISAIYFPASMSAALQGGLHLVYGMTLFAGGVEVLFSFFLQSLRKFFPPVVCGLIIMAVGFQLGLLAISQTLSVALWGSPFYDRHIIASAVTLFTMVSLTIWAKGMWRLLSPFFGIAAGFLLSLFLQIVPSLTQMKESPWFSFPSLDAIGYQFSWDLALPFAMAAIASSLRVVGGVTTCQKMNRSSWTKPDLKNIKKGIYADGIGCFFGGLLGVSGLNMAPSLIGVARATGATSRCIAYSLALWLFVLAFLPKFIHLFLAIPLSVMGAALLFTASFMIAGGIDLITARKIDTRAILTIGISLLLGVSQTVYSHFFADLPSGLKMFTNSLLSVVTLSAFILNLLFRIGVRQKVSLGDMGKGKEGMEDWFQEKANKWGLSSNIVERMRLSAISLNEQLQKGYVKEGEVKIDLIYDPEETILRFAYQGSLPKLRFDIDKERDLIEETSFTEGLSNYFSDISADEIKTTTKNASCSIDLYFHL